MSSTRGPRLLPLALALALAACASAPAQTCPAPGVPAVLDALYFGSEREGGTVSAMEWQEFLARVVTPRFPQGFSVSEVTGQWRKADGGIVREATHVVQIVHADSPEVEHALRQVMERYKAEFRQEAVLRVTTPACTSL